MNNGDCDLFAAASLRDARTTRLWLERADLRDPSALTHVVGALFAGELPDLA